MYEIRWEEKYWLYSEPPERVRDVCCLIFDVDVDELEVLGSDDANGMNLPFTILLLDARLLPPKVELEVDALLLLLPHSKLQVGPRPRRFDSGGASGPALRRSIAQRLRNSARHTALSLANLLHV